MINNLFQSNLLALFWFLGAIFLVCVIVLTTASPRFRPQRAGAAFSQPAVLESPLSIPLVDLTTAQPFGNPASGPVAILDSEQVHAVTQHRYIASINGHGEAGLTHGPWVIYLSSLRREDDAMEFIAEVQSQGVSAKTYAVTVRGDKYWRVYVPGFATANQAKANAIQIKNKLGLDDYWIAKR